MDQALDECRIGLSAERVHAVENAGDVKLEVVDRVVRAAAGRDPSAVPSAADDDDAVAPAAARRFDRELLERLEPPLEPCGLVLRADDIEQRGHGYSVAAQHLLAADLVVDERIEAAGIVHGDVAAVSSVATEHACTAKRTISSDHTGSA